ncbi:MAG: fibronectin type III-like domain-contianing protein [Acidobacteriaceae bacterium]|nr:fibronectin type III-like domain-contianing protein [Acidobacteriaceae bacterium]
MANRTYRYFRRPTLFDFGYGLSYANFRYSNLRTALIPALGLLALVDVKNDSDRDGDEVVQMYLATPRSPDGVVRELKAFARVHILAHQTQIVAFHVAIETVPKRSFRVSLGGGQPVHGNSFIESLISR